MKVSVSAPPETDRGFAVARAIRGGRWWIGAAYAAAHLPLLAPSLEDIDSINFALGLRDFDPASHQPHPPGYPVYIALGRLSLFLVELLVPGWPRHNQEAAALAFWSAIGAGAAIAFAYGLFAQMEAGTAGGDPHEQRKAARWATLFLGCAPLFLMTGLRPMSDMPGLAAALAAQGLLVAAIVAGRGGLDARASRLLVAGAFGAGFALGLRSQTLWLTLPLLMFCVALQLLRPCGRTTAARATAAFGAGAVAWAVPLVIASGGLARYLQALSAQAGEDFAFVDMLWANPSVRGLAFAIYRTLVLPWASLPLAVCALVMALVGAVVLLLRQPRVLLVLTVAFGPYLVFHLIFQETVTVRYALPLLVPLCFLAAHAITPAGRLAKFIAVPFVAAALVVALPGAVTYGRNAHAAARAVDDMARREPVDQPAFVTAHASLRRALAAGDLRTPVRATPATDARMEVVRYWAGGGKAPVWLLADPRRSDLELIDRFSRLDVVRYRWPVADRPELSGTRPRDADWYRVRPPGWFLGEGWSLTPETGGVTSAAGRGPHVTPIVGYVHRAAGPVRLMIGGRHLGEAADGDVEFELALEGIVIDRWRLTFAERNFLRFLTLPEIRAGQGDYARLTVASRPLADPGRRVAVAVRQFDAQPLNRAIWGFAEGWHEAEYQFESGLRWRWTSERSVVRVQTRATAIRLNIRGESPLKYFDAPPAVAIRAGERIIAQFRPDSDFTWDVVVPADALDGVETAIAIETDRVYVPSEAEGSADQRRLGLRILDWSVRTDD